MKLKRIHHVAYRCKDAKETVEFYERVLNMDFMLAFAEDQVPSTKEPEIGRASCRERVSLTV